MNASRSSPEGARSGWAATRNGGRLNLGESLFVLLQDHATVA
ncbi:hypothetical protein FrEUN1fDRAFT_6931 [Parafrankia sp. EUN1f]|nr:hypothetical protein FrEUN1fDRAFT_6931 [Parafrankia sp. EUN1f]